MRARSRSVSSLTGRTTAPHRPPPAGRARTPADSPPPGRPGRCRARRASGSSPSRCASPSMQCPSGDRRPRHPRRLRRRRSNATRPAPSTVRPIAPDPQRASGARELAVGRQGADRVMAQSRTGWAGGLCSAGAVSGPQGAATRCSPAATRIRLVRDLAPDPHGAVGARAQPGPPQVPGAVLTFGQPDGCVSGSSGGGGPTRRGRRRARRSAPAAHRRPGRPT